jgi:hypothetical protein
MNVIELHRLARWFIEQYGPINRLYNSLLEPINNNANNPNKQPLESQLTAMTDFLSAQRFDELSIEQLKMLTSLGVDGYLGQAGADYVNATVRTSDYDPATARDRLQEAHNALNTARTKLQAYAEAVSGLGFGEVDNEAEDGLITIRVGFQNDVAISNVTEWKDTAKEWYDIIRGLSMACEEKPEDVKVIGAETGSIILVLAATAGFTGLLAVISKHITTVAKDIISVRVEMENLREKKILNGALEAEFKRIEKAKAEGATAAIEKLLEDKLKGKAGDVQNALTNSVKKLLTFSEKGGTVDFVAPGDELDDDVDIEADLKTALIEAREAIRDYQGERESLKQLADHSKPEGQG